MSDNFFLYLFRNLLNGKKYVGVTLDLERRTREHETGRSDARAFNAAMKKYGPENFERTILAVFDDQGAACYHEQEAIKKLDTLSPNGYNLVASAPFTQYGGAKSEALRAQWSVAHTGVPLSEEHRASIGRGRKGLPSGFKGHKHTAEDRAKAVASRDGYHPSDETRARMSVSAKNRRTL